MYNRQQQQRCGLGFPACTLQTRNTTRNPATPPPTQSKLRASLCHAPFQNHRYSNLKRVKNDAHPRMRETSSQKSTWSPIEDNRRGKNKESMGGQKQRVLGLSTAAVLLWWETPNNDTADCFVGKLGQVQNDLPVDDLSQNSKMGDIKNINIGQ
ncbi:unnamed protein product [Ectocarpus sp. 12 AP-2014]